MVDLVGVAYLVDGKEIGNDKLHTVLYPELGWLRYSNPES